MNDEQNRDAGRPDERPWQDAQSSGQQQGGMSQGQQQTGQQQTGQQSTGQQNDEFFQGSDNASDDLTSGQQSRGYGDREPAGQGADQTGGTSVTGQSEAQGEEADLSDVSFESDMDDNRS